MKRQAAFDPAILLYGIRGEYEHKFKQYQMLWKQKWSELDRLNRELHQESSKKFADEIDRVSSKYLFENKFSFESPCQTQEAELLDCYRANANRTLVCRNCLRKFSNCIESNRLKMLQQEANNLNG